MRGKVAGGDGGGAHGRIIPAGAGKSIFRLPFVFLPGDHPRGCGEKGLPAHGLSHCLGSSPRVRGKASGGECRSVGPGIIPAGAGKRDQSADRRRDAEDHPRGCGEKDEREDLRRAAAGSSPRVRGKEALVVEEIADRGIIPAGAGKRKCQHFADFHDQDHPRGCGEKPPNPATPRSGAGSSPRVRGKGRRAATRAEVAGIIPAGAGKSWADALADRLDRDHPRGCGEKTKGGVGREGVEHWEEGVFIEFGVWRRGGG